MQPPNRGFNRVAWLLPYGVAVVCLLGVALTALRWSRRPAARPPRPGSTPSWTPASSMSSETSTTAPLRSMQLRAPCGRTSTADAADVQRRPASAPNASVLAAVRARRPGRRHAGRVRLARPVAGGDHPPEPGRLRGGGRGRRRAADAAAVHRRARAARRADRRRGAPAPRSSARRRWRCAPSRTSSSTTRWGRCRTRTSPRWAARLRTRAAGLMRQLDAGASYSAQIEREADAPPRSRRRSARRPAARARPLLRAVRRRARRRTRGSARQCGHRLVPA